MMHSNRMVPWLVGAAALAALLIAFGAPLASLLPFAIVLACPLMMVFMMRGMHGSGEDHTGHGCEHDPTRRANSASPQPVRPAAPASSPSPASTRHST